LPSWGKFAVVVWLAFGHGLCLSVGRDQVEDARCQMPNFARFSTIL